MPTKLYIAFCLAQLAIACSPKVIEPMNDKSSSNLETVRAISKELLGGKAEVIANENDELYLCLRNVDALVKRFLVLDGDGNLIYPSKQIRGNVSWYSNTQLSLIIDPGHLEQSGTSEIAIILDLFENQEKL